MPDSTPDSFHSVRIAENKRLTPQHFHIALSDIPQKNRGAFRVPGQYILLKDPKDADGKPGFFALANRPGSKNFELLIKEGNGLAGDLCRKQVGENVFISNPQGNGYPIDQQHGKNIWIIGVGSGIAPLRSLTQYLAANRKQFGAIHLIYGCQSEAHIPFLKELCTLEQHSIHLSISCSKEEKGNGKTIHALGYVQHFLSTKEIKFDESDCAFLCGMKPMVEEVTAVLTKKGLAAEQIFQNF